ncbi:MAG: hypothetical protein ACW98Y_22290, partial [Candidatus Thorarchaeota archaeon]
MIGSKSNIFNDVRIWVEDDITRGHVVFDSSGPSLVIESGEVLERNIHDVYYELNNGISIDENGELCHTQLQNPVIVRLTPKFITSKSYHRDVTELPDDIHPPSSNGWYGRMIRGKKDVLYIIQELKDIDDFWMTVFDPDSNTVLECHLVQRYEIEVLRLIDSLEHFTMRLQDFAEGSHAEIRARVVRVLDDTSLSWKDIHFLSRGWPIPVISRGKTSRETLTRLFSINEYSENTREEVLAFLAWTVKESIPTSNLVSFVENLERMPTFRSLLINHLKMLIDKEPIPSYVMLASLAAKGEYSRGLSIQDMQSQRPHMILRHKVQEMAPDWQAEAIQIVKALDNSDKLSLVLPKSKKTHSTERMRFLMSTMGFSLRAHIQPMNIGLHSMMHLGET